MWAVCYLLSSLEKAKTTDKQSRLRAISSPSHVLSSSSRRFLNIILSYGAGLAFVIIVTGDAFCVVVPYGLGLCCRDLAITGLAFAIVAGTGIAPVVFIRLRALALLSLPLRASPLFC